MVVNSAEAKVELAKIVGYFEDLEDNLPPSDDIKPLLADRSLTGRLTYMKASLRRHMKSVSLAMQEICK